MAIQSGNNCVAPWRNLRFLASRFCSIHSRLIYLYLLYSNSFYCIYRILCCCRTTGGDMDLLSCTLKGLHQIDSVYMIGFCWHFIRNHLFLQGVTTLITQSMMLLMIVSAYIAYDEVGSQVLFPIGVYCMHRLMVGLKYGTLSPTEYR